MEFIMMIEPGISKLSKCADSRYTLVVMAAKRARMIGAHEADEEKTGKKHIIKPVSEAVQEIADGKVGYIRNISCEDYLKPQDWQTADYDPAEENVSGDMIRENIEVSERTEDQMDGESY